MAQQQEKVRGLYSKSAGDSTAQKDTNLDKSVEKTRKGMFSPLLTSPSR